MKVQISFFLLFTAVLSLDGDGDSDKSRKHYGLSYHANCRDYIKTFTCLSACKSIGFQVFRMDFTCKCSCHELKTTTLLPFFKWRTNGTTRTWANTQSPHLYHIIGTLSPATYPDYTDSGNVSTTDEPTETSEGGGGSEGGGTGGSGGSDAGSEPAADEGDEGEDEGE